MSTGRNITWIIGIMALLFMGLPLVTGSVAHAITMEESDVTIKDYGYSVDVKDGEIEDAVSANEDIVEVSPDSMSIFLSPMSAGTTNVTVYGDDGSTAVVRVTVDAGYMKERLKRGIEFSNDWYGSRKFIISAEPGASGKLVIGGDTYKYKVGDTHSRTIKLKKVYPLNKAYKVVISNFGVTLTLKGKITSQTYIENAYITGKKLELNTWNVHKGDKVRVTFKGKTYTKKITRNKDEKGYTVNLKLKKKPKHNAKIKVVILNKSNKTLYKKTLRFSNYAFMN